MTSLSNIINAGLAEIYCAKTECTELLLEATGFVYTAEAYNDDEFDDDSWNDTWFTKVKKAIIRFFVRIKKFFSNIFNGLKESGIDDRAEWYSNNSYDIREAVKLKLKVQDALLNQYTNISPDVEYMKYMHTINKSVDNIYKNLEQFQTQIEQSVNNEVEISDNIIRNFLTGIQSNIRNLDVNINELDTEIGISKEIIENAKNKLLSHFFVNGEINRQLQNPYDVFPIVPMPNILGRETQKYMMAIINTLNSGTNRAQMSMSKILSKLYSAKLTRESRNSLSTILKVSMQAMQLCAELYSTHLKIFDCITEDTRSAYKTYLKAYNHRDTNIKR